MQVSNNIVDACARIEVAIFEEIYEKPNFTHLGVISRLEDMFKVNSQGKMKDMANLDSFCT